MNYGTDHPFFPPAVLGFHLCLMLLPAVAAIVRIMLQRVWKCEKVTAGLALPLDLTRRASSLLFFPLRRELPLAFLAIIRNMIPGRIIGEGLPTALTGLLEAGSWFSAVPAPELAPSFQTSSLSSRSGSFNVLLLSRQLCSQQDDLFLNALTLENSRALAFSPETQARGTSSGQ